MDPRESIDPPFHRLNVGFDVVAPRQPNNGLRQRQRILGAMIDFPGQQTLTFFRLLPFSDFNGDTADTRDTAALVERSRGRADAPAHLAVRSIDSKLRFI